MSHQRTPWWLSRLLALLFFITVVLAGIALAIGSVSAQEAGNATATTTETGAGELIQPGLTLEQAVYEGDGTAELTFRVTSEAVAVTISDAGGFYQGGELARRTEVLQPGTHTISFPVTETPGGQVGVTIATADTLYAVPIGDSGNWFDGSSNWGTVRVAGAGGAVGILLVTGVLAWRKRGGGRKDSRRHT